MLTKLPDGHAIGTCLNELTKRCQSRLVTERAEGF